MTDIGMFTDEHAADPSPIVEMQLNTQLPGLYFCFYCKQRRSVRGCKIISMVSQDVFLVRNIGTSTHMLASMGDLLRLRVRFCATSAELTEITKELIAENKPKLFGNLLEEYIEKYLLTKFLKDSK